MKKEFQDNAQFALDKQSLKRYGVETISPKEREFETKEYEGYRWAEIQGNVALPYWTKSIIDDFIVANKEHNRLLYGNEDAVGIDVGQFLSSFLNEETELLRRKTKELENKI